MVQISSIPTIELKINNEHYEAIRKLNDERVFNIMKEYNSNNNKNTTINDIKDVDKHVNML